MSTRWILWCLLPACGPAEPALLLEKSIEDVDDYRPEPMPVRQDAGDSIETATPLELPEPSSLSWPLAIDGYDVEGDRDFYAVDVQAGEVVLAAALSMGLSPEANDLVMRLWSGDGRLLAENDDLPEWIWRGDPGLYWQATEAQRVYIELLDWGTWALDVADPAHAEPFQLRVATFTASSDEPNDTMDDLLAKAEAHDTWEAYLPAWPNQTFFYANLEHAEDRDGHLLTLWRDTTVLWATWPVAWAGRELALSVHDLEGRPIARSGATSDQQPFNAGFSSWGLVLPVVADDQTVHVSVEDEAGLGGPVLGLSATYQNLLIIDVEGDDQAATAPRIQLTPYVSSASTRWVGPLLGMFTPDDPADVACIHAEDHDGELSGRMLNLYVAGASAGSLATYGVDLTDAGGTVLASAVPPDDPTLGDLALVDEVLPDVSVVCVAATVEALPDDLSPVGTPWHIWVNIR
jgi:hypothetical protein